MAGTNINPLGQFAEQTTGTVYYKEGLLKDAPELGPGLYNSWKYDFDAGRQTFRAQTNGKVYEKRLVKDQYGTPKWTGWLEIPDAEARGVTAIAINEHPLQLPNSDGAIKLAITPESIDAYSRQETYDLIEEKLDEREYDGYFIYVPWHALPAVLPPIPPYFPQNASQEVKDALMQLLTSDRTDSGNGKPNIYYIVQPSDYYDTENYFIWDVVDAATNQYGWIQSSPVSGFVTYTVFNQHRYNTETHLSPTDRDFIDNGIPSKFAEIDKKDAEIDSSLSRHYDNFKIGTYVGDWSASRNYSIYNITLYKGTLWISNANNNISNEPNDLSSVWDEYIDEMVPNNLTPVIWDSTTAYSKLDLVKYNNTLGAEIKYISTIDNNVGHEPEENSIYWLEYVDVSTPSLPNYQSAVGWNNQTVYGKYDVVTGTPLQYYLSLSSNNMNNVIANPQYWLGFNINATGDQFNVSTTYVKYDLVEYNNRSWLAVNDVPSGNNPSTSSPFWVLVTEATTQNMVRYLHISEIERNKIYDSATELDLVLHKNDYVSHVSQGDRDRWDSLQKAPELQGVLYNVTNENDLFMYKEAYTQVQYGTEMSHYVVGSETQGLTVNTTVDEYVIGDFKNKFDEISPVDYTLQYVRLSVGPIQMDSSSTIQFIAYDPADPTLEIAHSPIWNYVDMSEVKSCSFCNVPFGDLKVKIAGPALPDGNFAKIANLKVFAAYTLIEQKYIVGNAIQGVRIDSNSIDYNIGDFSAMFNKYKSYDIQSIRIQILQGNSHSNDIQFQFYKPGSSNLIVSFSPVWTAADVAQPSLSAFITPVPFGRMNIKVMNAPPNHPGGQYVNIPSVKVIAIMRLKTGLIIGDRDQLMPMDLVGPSGIMPTYNKVPLRNLIENNFHTNEWGYLTGDINKQSDLQTLITNTSGNKVQAAPNDNERYDVFYKGTIKTLVQNEGDPPISPRTILGPSTHIKVHTQVLFDNVLAQVQNILNSGSSIQRIDFECPNVQCNVTGAFLHTDNQTIPISGLLKDQEDTPFDFTYTVYDQFSNFNQFLVSVPDKTVLMPSERGTWQLNVRYDKNDSVIMDATGQRYLCLIDDTTNRQPDRPGNEMYWKPYRNRGTWSNIATYSQNELVGFTKTDATGNIIYANSYISLTNTNINNEPPELGDSNWELWEVGIDPTVSFRDAKIVAYVITFGDIKAGNDRKYNYGPEYYDGTPYVNFKVVGQKITEESREINMGINGTSIIPTYDPGVDGNRPLAGFRGYPKEFLVKWNTDPARRLAHEWDVYYATDDIPESVYETPFDPNKWTKLSKSSEEIEAFANINVGINHKFYSSNADLTSGKNLHLKAYDAAGNLVGNDVVEVYEQEIDSRYANRNRFQNLGTNGGTYNDTLNNAVTVSDDNSVVNSQVVRSNTSLTKTDTHADTEEITITENIPTHEHQHKGQIVFETHKVKGIDTDPTKGIIDPDTNLPRKYTIEDNITKVKAGNGLEIVHVDSDATGTYGQTVDVTDADGEIIGTMSTDKYELRLNGTYDGTMNLFGDVVIGTETTGSSDTDTQLTIYSDTTIGTAADQNKVIVRGDTRITANEQAEEGLDHKGNFEINVNGALGSTDPEVGRIKIHATNKVEQDSDKWTVNADTSIDVATKATTLESENTIDVHTKATTLASDDTIDITTKATTLESEDTVDVHTKATTIESDDTIDITTKATTLTSENTIDITTKSTTLNSEDTISITTKATTLTSEDTIDVHTKATALESEDTINITTKATTLVSDDTIDITTKATAIESEDTIDIHTKATTLTSDDTIDVTTKATTIESEDTIDVHTKATSISSDDTINITTKATTLVSDDTIDITTKETTVESTDKFTLDTANLDINADDTTIDGTSLTITETDTTLVGEELVVNQTTSITETTPAYELNATNTYTLNTDVETHSVGDQYILDATNKISETTKDFELDASDSVTIHTDVTTINSDTSVELNTPDAKIVTETIDIDGTTSAKIHTPDLDISDSTHPGTQLTYSITGKTATTAGNDSEISLAADNIHETSSEHNIDATTSIDLTSPDIKLNASNETRVTTPTFGVSDTSGSTQATFIIEGKAESAPAAADSEINLKADNITLQGKLELKDTDLHLDYTNDILIEGDNSVVIQTATAETQASVKIELTAPAIEVTGDTEFTGDITQTGDYTITGDVAISGTTTVTGDISQTGNYDITGDISQTGNYGVVGNVDITGDVDIDGTTTTKEIDANGLVTFNASAEVPTGQVITINDLPTNSTDAVNKKHIDNIGSAVKYISLAPLGTQTPTDSGVAATQTWRDLVTGAEINPVLNVTGSSGIDIYITDGANPGDKNIDISASNIASGVLMPVGLVEESVSISSSANLVEFTDVQKDFTNGLPIPTPVTTVHSIQGVHGVDIVPESTSASGNIEISTEVLETELADHETRITNVTAQANVNSGNITILQSRATNLENRATSLEGRMTTAESDIVTNAGEIAQHETRIDDLETFKTNASQRVVKDNSWAAGGIGNSVVMLGTYVTLDTGVVDGPHVQGLIHADYGLGLTVTGSGQIDIAVDSAVIATQSDITGLDGRVTQNETDIADHESRIVVLEQDSVDHEGRISTLESTATNHETRITGVELLAGQTAATVASQGTRLTTAENTITNHEGRITQNETDIADHESRLVPLETLRTNANSNEVYTVLDAGDNGTSPALIGTTINLATGTTTQNSNIFTLEPQTGISINRSGKNFRVGIDTAVVVTATQLATLQQQVDDNETDLNTFKTNADTDVVASISQNGDTLESNLINLVTGATTQGPDVVTFSAGSGVLLDTTSGIEYSIDTTVIPTQAAVTALENIVNDPTTGNVALDNRQNNQETVLTALTGDLITIQGGAIGGTASTTFRTQFTGYETRIAALETQLAALQGLLPLPPSDGQKYAYQDGAWVVV